VPATVTHGSLVDGAVDARIHRRVITGVSQPSSRCCKYVHAVRNECCCGASFTFVRNNRALGERLEGTVMEFSLALLGHGLKK
jgi:hypothetical protein